MFKRLFEFFFSLIAIIISSPLMLFAMLIIYFEDFKNPIFSQKRIGKRKKIFTMFKLRTMNTDAPNVATHEAKSSLYLKSSTLIRKLKLDELPQFFNVLIGEMSIVGPRPCLPNQSNLIHHREKRGIFDHKPGITGISQLKNIMMDQEEYQSKVDSTYNTYFGKGSCILKNIYFYFYCILNTAIKMDKNLVYLDKIIQKVIN